MGINVTVDVLKMGVDDIDEVAVRDIDAGSETAIQLITVPPLQVLQGRDTDSDINMSPRQTPAEPL